MGFEHLRFPFRSAFASAAKRSVGQRALVAQVPLFVEKL
jgi:hypothetical protein